MRWASAKSFHPPWTSSPGSCTKAYESALATGHHLAELAAARPPSAMGVGQEHVGSIPYSPVPGRFVRTTPRGCANRSKPSWIRRCGSSPSSPPSSAARPRGRAWHFLHHREPARPRALARRDRRRCQRSKRSRVFQNSSTNAPWSAPFTRATDKKNAAIELRNGMTLWIWGRATRDNLQRRFDPLACRGDEMEVAPGRHGGGRAEVHRIPVAWQSLCS